jgi:hypothetical protein
MREAKLDDKIVVAGLNTPDIEECPDCNGEVHKRRCRRMDGSVTFYYRHKRAVGKDWPKRSQLPTSD